jgi:hypothetical protein
MAVKSQETWVQRDWERENLHQHLRFKMSAYVAGGTIIRN